MDKEITEHVIEIAVLAGILVIGWLLGLPLRRRAATSPTPLGALLEPLTTPLVVLVLSGLLRLACDKLPKISALGNDKLFDAWLAVWGVVTALALFEGLLALAYRLRGRAFPLPGLLRNLMRGLLLGAAVLAVLRYGLKINISPLLASTALLTAIIGFALQGVLGNLLAGMSIHITRSLRPGDWISAGDTEGEVLQTNWRETHLRSTAGHTLVMPNSKLADATVHNMSWPTPVRRHSLFVGASYDAAPAEVVEALLESAAAVPDVLREPAPAAFPIEFKDFGINYELRIWTNQHQRRTPISGAVNRMIWYQFKRRGIEIPFPMSDKLLCDFMHVVNGQQHLPTPPDEAARRVRALQRSDFIARLFVDAAGHPLLAEADLVQLAPLLRFVRYTTGETIFRQGDAGESCYVIVSGKLRGRVDFLDATAPTEFELPTGALCGEMSLVTGLPRAATLTAPEEVELLEISPDAFTKLLGLRPEIPEKLAALVADRAAQNAQNYEKLKAMGGAATNALKRDSLLQRFKRLLGLAPNRG
ncbi:MAG: mechanosensitive ion channel family protein [Kiritimatiellaeota bacterium]|nr:mechanosensitive ion channel family protein [Kiritimatiellota bacterium]